LRGRCHRFSFSNKLREQLLTLSRRENATIFMTLLAAWNVLIFRYGGQRSEKIVVGTPIANRTRSEVEGLIGFFMNTVALATDLSGDPTFRALLGRVREVCLAAYTHQDVPFEKLVSELAPERDASRNPVFQIWFVLQNTRPQALDLPGLSVTEEPIH